MRVQESDNAKISLGILRSWNSTPLTKRISATETRTAPRCRFYREFEEVSFESPQLLFEFLSELAEDFHAMPTTARLTDAGKKAMEEGRRREAADEATRDWEWRGPGIRRKFSAEEEYREPHVERRPSRVLLIDIDGIKVPETDTSWRDDLAGFAETTVRRFLPSRFRNVSCWAGLSASAGIKRAIDGSWLIGLHLVFVADVPLDGKERQALVRQNSPEVGGDNGKIDLSTLLCTQPYYTARPVFGPGMRDPAPMRSVAVERETESVQVDRPSLAAADRLSGSPGRRADGAPGRSGGCSGHLERLGDGEGLNGFHKPLRAALASLAAAHGDDVDWEAVKRDLRARIDTAPKRAGRENDIRSYKSDEYLDASFRGALAKYAPMALAPRACPQPKGDVEEARSATRRAIDDFVTAVIGTRDDARNAHAAAE